MTELKRLMLAASAATLAFGCAKKAEEAPVAPAEDIVAAEEPAAEPMVEAEVADAAPIGSADITVTMTNGAPAFGSVSEGACAPGGVSN